MVIERIKYEPTFVTNKFEFYYSSYNNENSYLNYEFDYVREGVEYMVVYTIFKEEIYVDIIRNEPMVKVENPTIFGQYPINSRGPREKYLKPHTIVLTETMKKQDNIKRFFAQYKLDKYDRIFEIDKLDFIINSNFYDKLTLTWKLQGSKEDIILYNTKQLKMAERRLAGIEDFLDPLEFYEEEITPYEEIQEKLSRLKITPESTTDTSPDLPPLPVILKEPPPSQY
jgi:hypothetical protein